MTTAVREGWSYSQRGHYWFRDLLNEDFQSVDRGGYDLFWATHDGPKWGQMLGHYDILSAAMATGDRR